MLFKRKLGGRKNNFHLNLFLLMANLEIGIMLHLGPSSLYTTNNSSFVLSFFLEYGFRLHKVSKTNWLETALFILVLPQARNKNLSFVLALFWLITHMYKQFTFSWGMSLPQKYSKRNTVSSYFFETEKSIISLAIDSEGGWVLTGH